MLEVSALTATGGGSRLTTFGCVRAPTPLGHARGRVRAAACLPLLDGPLYVRHSCANFMRSTAVLADVQAGGRAPQPPVFEQLSLSRGDKWDPTPADETVDLISSLDRPAFDVLDYLNWCRFLDRDMKGKIAPADE